MVLFQYNDFRLGIFFEVAERNTNLFEIASHDDVTVDFLVAKSEKKYITYEQQIRQLLLFHNLVNNKREAVPACVNYLCRSLTIASVRSVQTSQRKPAKCELDPQTEGSILIC